MLERRRAGAVGELDVRSCADEEAANLGVGFAAVAEDDGLQQFDAGNGRVSVGAPLGRALADRCVGETVDVETPRGMLAYKILSGQRLVPKPDAPRPSW